MFGLFFKTFGCHKVANMSTQIDANFGVGEQFLSSDGPQKREPGWWPRGEKGRGANPLQVRREEREKWCREGRYEGGKALHARPGGLADGMFFLGWVV